MNPLIHTIRALVINPTGADPMPTLGYLRFALEGADEGNGANYVPPTEEQIGSYNVQIDLATGTYGNGKLVFANRVVDSPRHPTSGVLVEGALPRWDEALQMMRRIALKVGACEYLGFDACITERGPMIMEINSHSGIKYLQLFHPIWKDETLAPYFRERLAAIDALDEAGRRRRNAVAH